MPELSNFSPSCYRLMCCYSKKLLDKTNYPLIARR